MKSKEQIESGLDLVAAYYELDPTANLTWADLARRRGPTQWAWPGWLPHGFLTILAGEPGLGKSSLCLRLAACYVDGRAWPDDTPFSTGRGKVLWVESEGGHNVNVERAQRWGLDPTQIITPIRNPERNYRLTAKEDSADLILSASRDDVRLIILDSLGGLSAGNTSPRVLRELLGALARIANNTGKPVLLTHHLRKRTNFDHDNGRPNLDRLLGSSIVSQIPRLIWALDLPDPANPETRRLSVIKNNLASFPDPLGVRMDDYGLTFGPPPEPLNSQLEQAVNFLTGHLAAGPLPATQVLAAADAAGLARPTLRRAKRQLRIQSQKQPDQWVWWLP